MKNVEMSIPRMLIEQAFARSRAENYLLDEALADVLIDAGLAGDVSALREIGDRLDGKPAQTQDITITDERSVIVAVASAGTLRACLQRINGRSKVVGEARIRDVLEAALEGGDLGVASLDRFVDRIKLAIIIA